MIAGQVRLSAPVSITEDLSTRLPKTGKLTCPTTFDDKYNTSNDNMVRARCQDDMTGQYYRVSFHVENAIAIGGFCNIGIYYVGYGSLEGKYKKHGYVIPLRQQANQEQSYALLSNQKMLSSFGSN